MVKGCLTYRPDLDGLRAIAVIPVILFHMGLPQFAGGFVGVDVFFVLSGYLITYQILAALQTNSFSIIDFYDRRMRRLLPALFAMLFATTIASILVLMPEDLANFGRSLAAASLSVSNFYFWQQSDYFSPAAETMPLLHTWSLSVEEQFYLVVPALLLGLWSKFRTHVFGAILGLFFISLAISVWGASAFAPAAFYLLPSRAWELLLGSLLVFLIQSGPPPGRIMQSLASVVGLGGIALAIFSYDQTMPFPGAAALLPCVGAALVIWSGARPHTRPTYAGQILALPPLVSIGKISYSLYLWHWPIIVFARYSSDGPWSILQFGGIISFIFAVSYLSWRFIEQPFRRGGLATAARARRFAAVVAGFASLVVAGLALKGLDGLGLLLPDDAAAMLAQAKDSSPARSRCHFATEEQGVRNFSQACVVGKAEGAPVIIFADSHGAELSYAIFEVAEANGLQVRQITASGCPPLAGVSFPTRGGCQIHNQIILDALDRQPPSVVVIAAHLYDWFAPSSPIRSEVWPGLERTVARLRAKGHEVILLGAAPPHPAGRLPEYLAKKLVRHESVDDYTFAIDLDQSKTIDANLRSLAERTGSTYLPTQQIICGSDQLCRGYQNGHTIYFDANHPTVSMSRRVVSDLLPIINKLRQRMINAAR